MKPLFLIIGLAIAYGIAVSLSSAGQHLLGGFVLGAYGGMLIAMIPA